MNEAHLPDDTTAPPPPPNALNALLAWLAAPPAQPEDDLAPLLDHLATLRAASVPSRQRRRLLALLGLRSKIALRGLHTEIAGISLPLSRRSRHIVRGLQNLLLTLAEDILRAGASDAEAAWRALDALAAHLAISSYAGAPYAPGVWKMAHQIHRDAIAAGHVNEHVREAACTVGDTYLRACLLASVQPASFTAPEIDRIVDYIARFSSRAAFIVPATQTAAAGSASIFWIDTSRDAPPTSANRLPPPAGTLCFTCEQLAQLAEEQADALEAGVGASELDLPESAGTPAGQGILRRLAHRWGNPGKRRFPRRRQNHLSELCIGFKAVRSLFDEKATQPPDTSQWIVTNESPDGYAVMHVSGRTGRLTAGDLAGVRAEGRAGWEICIIRRVQSENPEHLELGLQILGTRAQAAMLVSDGEDGAPRQQPVLALPALPPVRPEEVLLAPVGTVSRNAQTMALVVEGKCLEAREIRPADIVERTAGIELLTFSAVTPN
ncbi:MAG: hypothetical protein RBT86_02590 [Azospira sp.]|jgi:hypothetical protein|nr:hypothetical protein [Azospira sp.]